MPKIKTNGPISLWLPTLVALVGIGLATLARQVVGRRIAPDWDTEFETGVLFWRRQFTRAMRSTDITAGRRIFDSVVTETDDIYLVTQRDEPGGAGRWYLPDTPRTQAVILYCHGGGYSFHAAVTRRFAAMLAHHTGARLYAPDYRLTPEHPHPAQAEDALAAWHHVRAEAPPERIVVIGDSAGGHMALMLLQTLRTGGLPQPALCIALCPWTDIGDRGASLHGNDATDVVQGWMALEFGRWLNPEGRFHREALSPVHHDYAGLAPIYLQAGGREVLRDMIVDFAQIQAGRGADVMLDLWPDMPHDFQAYDSMKRSSAEALARIAAAVHAAMGETEALGRSAATQIVTGGFADAPQSLV